MKASPIALAASVVLVGGCSAAPAGTGPGDPERPESLNLSLVSYRDCDAMLDGLREATAKHVTPYGLPGDVHLFGREAVEDGRMTVPNASGEAGRQGQAQEHSTTNVHEAGVDEPDLVKTDGRRVVTVNAGKLRLIDARSRKVTGSLRLGGNEFAHAGSKLLLDGDRVLIINPRTFTGPEVGDRVAPVPQSFRLLLADISGAPKVISKMTVTGNFVDARLVGGTARVVATSSPRIEFPQPRGDGKRRLEENRQKVKEAPLAAWLPRYEVDGKKRTIPCERISHPPEYTGTSMLSVHSIALGGRGLSATDPIGVVADGDTVYGTARSLYVTSNPWLALPPMRPGARAEAPKPRPQRTQVHQFATDRPGAPRYVASGSVPGRLLNQYSLSEHEGHLRVATTTGSPIGGGPETEGGARSSSGVHVLARSGGDLKTVGKVTGLGKNERIYSVRFIGPVGYVVTFRRVDPLYTIDLRDPAKPEVTGELKIPGYSAYLHPAGEGRLIGIGQEATKEGRVTGSQISLFDVSDPAAPERLAQRKLGKNTHSEIEHNAHAFLYWPKTRLAVIPVFGNDGGRAEMLTVTDDAIEPAGTLSHPGRGSGIQRSLVIGSGLWTVSDDGIQVSDLDDGDRQSWIEFK